MTWMNIYWVIHYFVEGSKNYFRNDFLFSKYFGLLVQSADFSYISHIKCQWWQVFFFLRFACLKEVLNISEFLVIF